MSSITQNLTNVISQSVQDCEVSSTQRQNLFLQVNGLSLDNSITLTQATDINTECFQDQSRQVDLQNQIFNTIAQTSIAQGKSLLSAFGNQTSTATTNLQSLIQTNVTLSNIQQQYNILSQEQSANVTINGAAILTNISLQQGAQVFAVATMKILDSVGILNTLQNYVNQESQTQSPSLFNISLPANFWLYVILLVAILLGVWAGEKILSSSG